MPAASWRLLDTPPAAGAYNMALDEALMESVRAGGAPVLRFYRWSPACLSLGRNQPAAGFYDEAALRARGIDVVRRRTGGRAVLHHRELTYSVVMPDRLLGTPRAAYSAINLALVAGLSRLGVPAALQGASPHHASPPSLAPCFREPAEGEVVIGGRKLVGSAQVRQDGVILQHGSLLLSDDQSAVAGLLVDQQVADPPPATLSDHMDRLPAWDALVDALVMGWREVVPGATSRDMVMPDEEARAADLAREYAGMAWTWHK